MRKVSSINVLDHKIKVVYEEMEDWGECFMDDKLIKLNKKCLKDPEQHWWTLVHEVTHMIFEMTGLAFMENNDEEAYVRCVENLVIPWVLNNINIKG
jgi:Zn-dependent peptidase ImmA (M78 family)